MPKVSRVDIINHLFKDSPIFLLIGISVTFKWTPPMQSLCCCFSFLHHGVYSSLSLYPLAQWMEAGHPGQTGPRVTSDVVAGRRNVLAHAQILLLSMGELSVRACRCRKARATHCVQVSKKNKTPMHPVSIWSYDAVVFRNHPSTSQVSLDSSVNFMKIIRQLQD